MKLGRIILFFIIFCATRAPAKTIYFVPSGAEDYHWHSLGKFAYPLQEALERLGYTVRLTNDIAAINQEFEWLVIFCDMNVGSFSHEQFRWLCQYPLHKRVLCMWEPPTISPVLYDPRMYLYFSKVFSWHDPLVDQQKIFKFNLPIWRQPVVKNGMVEWPMSAAVPFEQKKLCVLISSYGRSAHPQELYSARYETVQFFEKKPADEFDLYGRSGWPTTLKNYRGSVSDKHEVMRHYKFCICYENTKDMDGYISEKIFDCFFSLCVPVYWGAGNIAQYIPENCYIRREDFATHQELYLYIKHMPKELYDGYIRNIKKFLASPRSVYFSSLFFVHTLLTQLVQSYDYRRAFNPEQQKVLELLMR